MRHDETETETAPQRHTTTLATARELLMLQMSQLADRQLDRRLISPLMLWGPPGIGKSDLIRTLCEEHGWGFVDVRLAQRDPVDLRGLPVPQDGVVRWLPSSEWPREPGSRGILLFDELTAADRTLQVAAYELILDRRLGDTYEIPPGWLVCGAGNRSEDSSVSVPMSAALANRFLHLDLAADLESWTRWARKKRLRSDLVAFLRFRPQLLLDMGNVELQRGWPSPRSWARVSAFLDAADGLSEDARRAGLMGLVGEGAAIELMAFLSITLNLPDFGEILRDEAPLEIPTRLDLKLAVVTGLARHVWAEDDRPTAMRVLLEIVLRLTPDFAAVLLADALDLAPAGRAPELLTHPLFEEVRRTHGARLVAHRPELSVVLGEQAGQSERRAHTSMSAIDR